MTGKRGGVKGKGEAEAVGYALETSNLCAQKSERGKLKLRKGSIELIDTTPCQYVMSHDLSLSLSASLSRSLSLMKWMNEMAKWVWVRCIQQRATSGSIFFIIYNPSSYILYLLSIHQSTFNKTFLFINFYSRINIACFIYVNNKLFL